MRLNKRFNKSLYLKSKISKDVTFFSSILIQQFLFYYNKLNFIEAKNFSYYNSFLKFRELNFNLIGLDPLRNSFMPLLDRKLQILKRLILSNKVLNTYDRTLDRISTYSSFSKDSKIKRSIYIKAIDDHYNQKKLIGLRRDNTFAKHKYFLGKFVTV